MDIIEEFLTNNCDTKSSEKTYRSHLKRYFTTMNADPQKYFSDGRNYDDDIMEYWRSIQELAPLSRRACISVIKILFEENDVNLSKLTKKKLRRKLRGSKPITIDVIPTNKQMRRILQYAEPKAKALFLLISSSGMRIGETLGLLPGDIPALDKAMKGEPYEKPIKIYIRAKIAKTKSSRIAFMSHEAFESLLAWMKERDEWLEFSVRKVRGLCKKDANDPTIFCFTYSTAIQYWHRLLRKAGFDEKDPQTNFHRMHEHVLRKFYETRMSYAGVPDAIYQQLEGHEGYLNGAYKRYTEQELADAYQKGVGSLLIFETQPDLTDVHEQLAEKDKEIKDMKQEMDKIRMDLLEVKMKQVQELQRNK